MIVVGGAAPSWAAWNDTHWGMGLGDIKGLYPDLTDKIDVGYTGKHFQVSHRAKPYMGLAVDEVDFTLLNRQGLQLVLLFTPAKFDDLDQLMTHRLGKPYSVYQTPFVKMPVFLDAKSDDEITIVPSGGADSLIRIRPLDDEEKTFLAQGGRS
jgi:hypothetical protein